MLLLLVEVKEYDLEIDDALVNLDVYDKEVLEGEVDATDLTLVGLTHSAWWERSLVLEMGLSQNSQGIMTTSSLELLSVTLLLVTTSAAVADLDRAELVTRLMLLDLKVGRISTRTWHIFRQESNTKVTGLGKFVSMSTVNKEFSLECLNISN